jgi:hypothetical protein
MLTDYGPLSDGITMPDLTPYIATASMTVDQAVKISQGKGGAYIISDPPAPNQVGSQAELLERWLSAHFYCMMDPNYKSKSTAGASATFQRPQDGKGLESTSYGQMAVAMDYSGALKNLTNKERARAIWLGKPPSQQVPYCQRN